MSQPSRCVVIGRSVRGAAHIRHNLPNQDAFAIDRPKGGSLVVAVADGHGSAKSFRSDRGATFAVQAAIEVLSPLTAPPDAEIARRLLTAWRAKVDADLVNEPVATHSPYLVYGSTLLAAVVFESATWLVQIGDGDILAVDRSGQTRRPVPGDSRLFANETTSLCQAEAERAFRFGLVPHSEEPALLLLSSDGYCNSYRDDAAFLQTGPDLLRMIATEGVGVIETSLEGWLEESSRLGSGDDVTLVLVAYPMPTPVASRKGTIPAPRKRRGDRPNPPSEGPS